ncbi:hypothetical protein C8J57DRAFT_1364749 [Mycena rebaudengoi]|nr:hypothetical protein C8J57DRAFT_1364749 [Mycena rebaudengoi]
MPVTPISSSRIFPDLPSAPCSVALFILDASVGNFAPTAAFWTYDASSTNAGKQSCTLNAYPQWAGQLQNSQYDPKGDHTTRSRRLVIAYGAPTDPGVELVEATSSVDVVAVFPSVEQRTSGAGAFDASTLGTLGLLPQSPTLASHGGADFDGSLCLIVQLTSFTCGGIVIALNSSHPLADAQTLITFVQDWAAVNRVMVLHADLPTLTPIFSPASLDHAALGDIDASAPDPSSSRSPASCPLTATTDGRHRRMSLALGHHPPAPRVLLTNLAFGPPIPWHEWDLQAPVSIYLLFFSADELSRIWAAATEFYFNLSLRIRGRLDPPLGARALGSPIVLARAVGTAQMSLPQLAREIRGVVTQSSPVRVGALLHEMAFDVDAWRMWGGFVGRRNTIVTSWVRLGVYEVDFGGGRPRFVQGIMPAMDGLMAMQVMEAMPPASSTGGPWYQDGASVSMTLTTEIIQRMLGDPLLRMYRVDRLG